MAGHSPNLISGVAKVAPSTASRRSQAQASPMPPARAWPLIRRTTGLPRSSKREKRSTNSRRSSWRSSSDASPPNEERSAPAQKARSPAPVSTTTRTSSASRHQVSAASRSRSMPEDSELRCSGRFSTTLATPSPTSTRTESRSGTSDTQISYARHAATVGLLAAGVRAGLARLRVRAQAAGSNLRDQLRGHPAAGRASGTGDRRARHPFRPPGRRPPQRHLRQHHRADHLHPAGRGRRVHRRQGLPDRIHRRQPLLGPRGIDPRRRAALPGAGVLGAERRSALELAAARGRGAAHAGHLRQHDPVHPEPAAGDQRRGRRGPDRPLRGGAALHPGHPRPPLSGPRERRASRLVVPPGDPGAAAGGDRGRRRVGVPGRLAGAYRPFARPLQGIRRPGHRGHHRERRRARLRGVLRDPQQDGRRRGDLLWLLDADRPLRGAAAGLRQPGDRPSHGFRLQRAGGGRGRAGHDHRGRHSRGRPEQLAGGRPAPGRLRDHRDDLLLRRRLNRVNGLRLAAALGLWLTLGAAVLGLTFVIVHFGLPRAAAEYRAAVGALLILEAYATLLAALLLAYGGWRGVRGRLRFRFTSFTDIALAIVTWIGALVAGVLATVLLSPLLGQPRSNATDLLGRSFDPLFVIPIVPTVCLLAPLCEELLFRGAIFGWLRSRLPVPVAAVLSAALFAGAPLLLPLFPELFVFGLAAAWIYQRTGSTLNSFVMHASQNTLAVVLTYLVLLRPG